MKKGENIPHRFETLSELHRVLGLPKPLHPLISLVENKDNEIEISKMPGTFIHDFYKISYKKNPKNPSTLKSILRPAHALT